MGKKRSLWLEGLKEIFSEVPILLATGLVGLGMLGGVFIGSAIPFGIGVGLMMLKGDDRLGAVWCALVCSVLLFWLLWTVGKVRLYPIRLWYYGLVTTLNVVFGLYLVFVSDPQYLWPGMVFIAWGGFWDIRRRHYARRAASR